MLASVTDGRTQEGAHRTQGRANCGQPLGLGVRREVRQPERYGNPAQVGEELRPAGQLQEPLVLFGSQAGGDEVLQLPLPVQGGNPAHPRAGQGARPVHDPLEHDVQVQVFGDADAGLAQPGEPLPQGLILAEQIAFFLQLLTPVGLPSTPGAGNENRAGRGGGIWDAPLQVRHQFSANPKIYAHYTHKNLMNHTCYTSIGVE